MLDEADANRELLASPALTPDAGKTIRCERCGAYLEEAVEGTGLCETCCESAGSCCAGEFP